MQTIISRSSRIPQNAGVVIYSHKVSELSSRFLSEEEIRFIKKNHTTDQRDFFFNSPGRYRFVILAGKSRNHHHAMEEARKAGARIVSGINRNRLHKIYITAEKVNEKEVFSLAEGIALANYRFIRYKSNIDSDSNPLRDIIIESKLIGESETDELNTIVYATCKCRDLVNEPSAFLSPGKLAGSISTLCAESGCTCEILNKKQIGSLKMGGLIAVNQGSDEPPVFIIAEWKPEDARNKKPYILTGKGVTFDTGGMNIKTADFMYNMKCDMAGGAAVASALYLIARNRLPFHVIALIPATDNRINSKAYVNGDIITMSDGTRVEVINTDAEGRLILADALVYAKKFKPGLVINLATLTGSAARAVGRYGLVAMSDAPESIFTQLEKAGEASGERLVRFPLWDEYGELIKSDIADVKNIGGTDAGAITAGKFLQRFTDYPFIHLDIAGPAFAEKGLAYHPAGATGTGVRLLYQFFKTLAIKTT